MAQWTPHSREWLEENVYGPVRRKMRRTGSTYAALGGGATALTGAGIGALLTKSRGTGAAAGALLGLLPGVMAGSKIGSKRGKEQGYKALSKPMQEAYDMPREEHTRRFVDIVNRMPKKDPKALIARLKKESSITAKMLIRGAALGYLPDQ